MQAIKSNLHKVVAGKKEDRDTLKNIYLDTDKKRLIATDGRAMAIIPVQDCQDDTSGAITPEAYKEALKLCKALDVVRLDCGEKTLTQINNATVPRPENLQFPDVDRIIDNKYSNGKTKSIIFSVAIQPALLANLAEALNAKMVTLEFTSDNAIIKVRPHVEDNEKQEGYIMPCKKLE